VARSVQGEGLVLFRSESGTRDYTSRSINTNANEQGHLML